MKTTERQVTDMLRLTREVIIFSAAFAAALLLTATLFYHLGQNAPL